MLPLPARKYLKCFKDRRALFPEPAIQQSRKHRSQERKRQKDDLHRNDPLQNQTHDDHNDRIAPAAQQGNHHAHALLDGDDFTGPFQVWFLQIEKQPEAGGKYRIQ